MSAKKNVDKPTVIVANTESFGFDTQLIGPVVETDIARYVIHHTPVVSSTPSEPWQANFDMWLTNSREPNYSAVYGAPQGTTLVLPIVPKSTQAMHLRRHARDGAPISKSSDYTYVDAGAVQVHNTRDSNLCGQIAPVGGWIFKPNAGAMSEGVIKVERCGHSLPAIWSYLGKAVQNAAKTPDGLREAFQEHVPFPVQLLSENIDKLTHGIHAGIDFPQYVATPLIPDVHMELRIITIGGRVVYWMQRERDENGIATPKPSKADLLPLAGLRNTLGDVFDWLETIATDLTPHFGSWDVFITKDQGVGIFEYWHQAGTSDMSDATLGRLKGQLLDHCYTHLQAQR